MRKVLSIKAKAIILAIISALALSVDRGYPDEWRLGDYDIGIFYNARLLTPLLIIVFFFFYLQVYPITSKIRENRRGKVCMSVLAALFSSFLIFGYSYQETDSWDLIFSRKLQMIKSCIAFIGFFIILYYVIAWIFSILDRHMAEGAKALVLCRPLNWYIQELRKYPFRVTFLTLVIFKLPYMITAYPAIFAGDTIDQLLQAFQIPYNSAESTNLITESQLINQHHSVFHTMLMHYSLLFGVSVFHSANIGLFLVAIFQTIITFSAISCFIRVLARENVSDIHILVVLAFFVLCPRIENMLFVLSKDVMYGAMTFISILLLWKILTGRQCNTSTKYLYILSLIGMMILRKEALYIILIQMVIYLFAARRAWKIWLGGIIATMAVYLLLSKIVFPAYNISPSPINEALSIPIQQTARYIRDYSGEISEEEKAAIDGMWDYDELEHSYEPNCSDLAKATFRKTSDSMDWINYFSVWFKMLIKHPGVYIQAVLNNYCEYYYSGAELAEVHSFERRAWDIDYVNDKLEDEGVYFHYPEGLNSARVIYENIRERLFGLPVLSLFSSVACYTWLLIGYIVYCVYKHNWSALLIFVPIILILLVCFVGPSYYFRYYYPIDLCLPMATSLTWIIGKENIRYLEEI